MKMRHALWNLHMAQGGTEDTFKEFYLDKMFSLTQMVYQKVEQAVQNQTHDSKEGIQSP